MDHYTTEYDQGQPKEVTVSLVMSSAMAERLRELTSRRILQRYHGEDASTAPDPAGSLAMILVDWANPREGG